MDSNEKIAVFKRLAAKNYDRSMGWSAFTECYDDADRGAFVDDFNTAQEIEQMMTDVANVNDDRYENARTVLIDIIERDDYE